jgi:uncharacterized membrane protein YsdA (DUF1294 family)
MAAWLPLTSRFRKFLCDLKLNTPTTPLVLLSCYAVVSLLTLLAYGLDKQRAQSQGRRIPESTLHLLSLLGGWPGALMGQAAFRHKRRKGSFMAIFWLTVILNSGALFALFQF